MFCKASGILSRAPRSTRMSQQWRRKLQGAPSRSGLRNEVSTSLQSDELVGFHLWRGIFELNRRDFLAPLVVVFEARIDFSLPP